MSEGERKAKLVHSIKLPVKLRGRARTSAAEGEDWQRGAEKNEQRESDKRRE